MRTRPPVGRRLWRRRRRRGDEVGATPAPAGNDGAVPPAGADDGDHDGRDHDGRDHDDRDHDDRDHEELDDDGNADVGPGARHDDDGPARPAEPGLPWWRRLFKRAPPPPTTAPADEAVDVVRAILALPRGAARLDAFAERLGALAAGSRAHRRVALAFHKELVGLADDAGVDLQLFEVRVTACAQALIAAGEDERAGALFARLGRRHQAAELFVKAGAIDALEELHAELAFAEGGARLDARLSFERFESLFLVGLRDDALAALQRAVSLWDNPVYAEVLAGFQARIPAAGRLVLGAGDDVVRLVPGLPVVLGRGEESAVRIDSPLVSRAHLELARDGERLVARDLVSAGGTSLDGVDAGGALGERGALRLAGVVLDYERNAQRLVLRARLLPRQATVVALGEVVDDVVPGVRLAVRDGRARLVAGGRARLNGEAPRRDTLLLVGDRVVVDDRTWTVAAR